MRRAKVQRRPDPLRRQPPLAGTTEYRRLGFREDTPGLNELLTQALWWSGYEDPLKDPDFIAVRKDATNRRRQHRAAAARRRGKHTHGEWVRVLMRADWKCLRCGYRPDDWSLLTKDHVVPVSRGGSDAIDNLQPLCHPCNVAKSDHTIDYRAARV